MLLAVRLNELVGPAALIDRIGRQRITQRKRTLAPLNLRATATTVFPIEALVIVLVSEHSVGMAEVATDRNTQILFHKSVVRRADFQRVSRAILSRKARTSKREWRQRMHVHHTRHRIATIERALRTAKQLDTAQIEYIEIKGILIEHRSVIDIQTHRGLVDSSTHTAHIDRRGHSRPIVGHIEIRSVCRHRTHIVNRLSLSVIHKYLGLGHRMFDQTSLLHLRRHRYLGHGDKQRIDTLRRQGGKKKYRNYRKCKSH